MSLGYWESWPYGGPPMKISRAKDCETCGIPIGWADGDRTPRNLDGTPHVCPPGAEDVVPDELVGLVAAPNGSRPQIVTNCEGTMSTPEYFAATVGQRRWGQFSRDLYESGTLLRKLGFFDDDENWCARVWEATKRLGEDVRLTAWLRIGKALLMAMNMDGYGQRASETLKKWIEWWPKA